MQWIQITKDAGGKIVAITITGKLDKEDYAYLVPKIEDAIKAHGKIRLLVKLSDFHGWHTGAAWEDTKFGARHFTDIDRIAIAGDRQWEKAMALLAMPFTAAEVRYFDIAETHEAKRWLKENL